MGFTRVHAGEDVNEVEAGTEHVRDSFWRAECPLCYQTHETDKQTEAVRSDLIEAVTACCDIEWLPPADWIDDCSICGTDHRESEDCTPLAKRDPFPAPDAHHYKCSECSWSGTGDAFEDRDGHCPMCETAAVVAVAAETTDAA